ncbi:MAG TPA: adenosylcobinamide-GDP ribazoletransferase [Ramlibacter sp.]|uniref:adenosylcobinamide-GDP ribazoletransferase n=1 Tax=Ramlibacter sp. TaxID=1917967 RepID=UPI002B9E83BE|nr:adenosylcobinamide-GDP ribazoletransferase [Ramlibacter sp.]HVZ44278.1 adenosylcobinamide-GDP ribazoletransferase [Ramlibacter sp.]
MTSPRDAIDRFLRRYLLAVRHYTRLPVAGLLANWVGETPEMLRASAPHLPGVGWLVGMAACVVLAAVSVVLPNVALAPFAAAAVSTIATVLLTGAMHEESLGRFVDANQADSAGGRAGTIAIVLVLALKLALIATLAARSPGAVLTALLAGHTVSRFWPLTLALALAPSQSSELPRPLQRRALAVSAVWCVVPLALMGLALGIKFALAGAAASGLALVVLRGRLRSRTSTASADALGAAQQVCEVAFYFGSALVVGGR